MKALEKELYDGGDVDSSGSGVVCRRRGIIKFAFGLGLAAAGVKVGGDYLGRVVFPKYEKPKETVSPEVEARRKLATENFEYLADRIGGDGAWMIKELSEKNSNFFDLQMDKLSKDYIDQNFRRYDNGPVIVGSEEEYETIVQGINLAKEKIQSDYEEFMNLVYVVRTREFDDRSGSTTIGPTINGKNGVVFLDREGFLTNVKNNPKATAFVAVCHEKNHIKYPNYTEEQVREFDEECRKKLGLK